MWQAVIVRSEVYYCVDWSARLALSIVHRLGIWSTFTDKYGYRWWAVEVVVGSRDDGSGRKYGWRQLWAVESALKMAVLCVAKMVAAVVCGADVK